MKKLIFFTLIILVLIISGCLTYQTAEFRLRFNDNSRTEGTIEAVYYNIETSEVILKDQQQDFRELIEHYQGDKFLLDNISDGIYIKERELYEKNGILIGGYKGIFRNLKFDNEPLKFTNDEFMMIIDTENDDIIETNGKIIKSEKNIIITWPKDQKELYWKLKMTGDPTTYSLIDMFREWKINMQ
ncbi:hypothetical protein ACFLSX_01330 [Calditrichota bacterium]